VEIYGQRLSLREPVRPSIHPNSYPKALDLLFRCALHRIVQPMLNYRLLDRVFRALADPTRRAIIERLSDGDASVSDLAEPLPISLAAVMQHVQALEQR
jgi:hypothetical protein